MKPSNISIKIYQSFIATLFGVAILVFTSCENDVKEIQLMNSKEELPQMELYDFELFFTEKNLIKYKISAHQALSYEGKENKLLFPKGVQLITYNKMGEIVTESQADSAVYFKNNKLLAYQNVRIIGKNNRELQTNFLTWDEKKKMFHTTDTAYIIRNGKKIQTIGMEAKDDFSTYKLFDITGKIELNENR
ncbi:MAG: LPS export ABC transporter periplasmic protein LptC [Flavobacteriales bacterium]|jgi:LPS export ABC transporter protein LptC|nr:LPS export ABC transporter periplasmic protein LptC [Flavobacteriales bacterium]